MKIEKENCLFCKIVAGEIPCNKIYEDERFLVFLDINPVNRGHSLVIPKKHSRNLLEMEDTELQEMSTLIKKIANHLKNKLKADGINIISNNESVAGQVIFHTHIHIIPRFEGDGFKHWQGEGYKEGEIEEIQKILRLN
ncbi:HIT family protein [Patescibacteria group bacterium]|nr:HIT family protein [Patescibacteria group bacterium]